MCKGKYIDTKGIELIYEVKLLKPKDNTLLEKVSKVGGINTVNLVASNTDTMG